jgi:hypothetical protein
MSFKLNGASLQMSKEEKHLGINRADDNSNMPVIKERIKSARRAAYRLMGAGFHGVNGVAPLATRKMWTMYVVPVLTYGLESLILNPQDIAALEAYQRESLKRLQHLPSSTANSAVYILLGVPPIEAIVHMHVLGLFCSAIRRKSSLECEVLERQLSVKDQHSCSWAVYVRSILRKYQLPSALDLLTDTPDKLAWKKLVKTTVLSQWTESLAEDAKTYTSLKFLNLDDFSLNSVHPIWRYNLYNALAVQKAGIKARLLVQRYPLSTSSFAGKKKRELCPICSEAPETLTHFLLHCPKLSVNRLPYLSRLLNSCRSQMLDVSPESLIHLILDPSNFLDPKHKLLPWFEEITRNLCFNLHHKRSQYLNGGSSYAHVRHRAANIMRNNKTKK